MHVVRFVPVDGRAPSIQHGPSQQASIMNPRARFILAILRGFQAEMQGKVIDRTAHFWIGDHPLVVKGRIASSKCPHPWINNANEITTQANQ